MKKKSHSEPFSLLLYEDESRTTALFLCILYISNITLSLITFLSPWLVSQEATLLFPVSSGIDGGLSSSVPLAEMLIPSLLSWLPEAEEERDKCKNTTQKSFWQN